MAHPFDNPYAERDPLPPRSATNFPTFDEFFIWARRQGFSHSLSVLARIYDDPQFRTLVGEANGQTGDE